MVMAQHSTPRSAPAVDGCQECLRESRGDRVMRHVKRTCRSFYAGRESMYDWVFDAATCVRVQSIFFEVTVVFPHKAAHSAFGASLTYLLPCGQGLLLRYSGLLRRIARTLSISVLEESCKGNTPLLPEVPSVGKTNNICDKENWRHETRYGRNELSLHACIWWSSELVQYFGEARQVVWCDWRHFVACQKAFLLEQRLGLDRSGAVLPLSDSSISG